MLQRYLHDSSLTDRLVTQANNPGALSDPSTLYNVDVLLKEIACLSSNYTTISAPKR